MNFNRRTFQYPSDIGFDRTSDLFRNNFEESFSDPEDMFSEGAMPPGRSDGPPDFPRFQTPGFSDDFYEHAFNRPTRSFFTRPRSAFDDIPIKVSHQRTGSGDISDNESRASGSSDGSTGSSRAPRVHHIPIHVETRPQKEAPRQQEKFIPEQRQNIPKRQSPEQQFFRSSTPQWREGSPHQFQFGPQFRERTFSDHMPSNGRQNVSIPVKVERSDSSPVLAEERLAQRKSPEKEGPEPNTGTFPRAKNQEAPLRWAQNFFRGPKQSESQPPAQTPPQPVPPPKVQQTPEEKINQVLADLQSLSVQVRDFQGIDSKAKEYRFLDEMLTRLMISLDDVIIDGNEDLRAARKNAIREVQRVLDELEKKIQTNIEQNKESAQNAQPVDASGDKAIETSAVAEDVASESPRKSESPRRSESPVAPKRDRSQKRQNSPSKEEKRSPSPKKGSKREQTPPTDAATASQVSVTVNGVAVQTSKQAKSNTPPPTEPTSPEPVLSTASIQLQNK